MSSSFRLMALLRSCLGGPFLRSSWGTNRPKLTDYEHIGVVSKPPTGAVEPHQHLPMAIGSISPFEKKKKNMEKQADSRQVGCRRSCTCFTSFVQIPSHRKMLRGDLCPGTSFETSVEAPHHTDLHGTFRRTGHRLHLVRHGETTWF